MVLVHVAGDLVVFPLGGVMSQLTAPDGVSVWFRSLGLVTGLQNDFSLDLVQS